VAGLPALKTESVVLAMFAFFIRDFWDLDGIYVHYVGVLCFQGGGRGEQLVQVRGFLVSCGNFIGMFPLNLEMNCLLVPIFDSGGNGVHEHDTVH